MSGEYQPPRRKAEILDDLTPDDRAWLTERLTEYRELLRYLHDH